MASKSDKECEAVKEKPKGRGRSKSTKETKEIESSPTVDRQQECVQKQTKIDEMLTQMAKENTPNIKDLIEIIDTFNKKMSSLVSQEYIDKSLQNLASKPFVSEKFDVLKKEISNDIKTEIDKVYEQLRTTRTKLLNSVNDINELKNDIEGMKMDIEKQGKETVELRNKNKELKEAIAEKDKVLRHHEILLNDHEQYSRMNSIRIYGLEDKNKSETSTQTEGLVIKMLNEKLHLDIQPKDIDIAHRLGQFTTDGNRPVICKFIHRSVKKQVIKVRRNLKGTAIVIREDLTIKNAKLLEKVSAKQEVKNAWSDDGKVIALLLNGKKLKIDLYTDLSKTLIPERELADLLAAMENK